MALGSVKMRGRSIPTDFAPFHLMNAVVNGPAFDTEIEAEIFIRSL